jgi:uncharacterized protein (TIGR03067 family)
MKKAIYLLFLFPLFLTAQDKGLQKENIILKARIDSLESRMDDKFYTRVPNKDFDQRLNDSVDKQVSNYISGRLALISTIVGLMSFLLGYLAKYFFSESTRKQIEASVKTASDTLKNDNADAQKILNTQLDAQKTFVSDNNKLYNDRLGDINTRIDNLRNGLNNQLQNYSSTVDKRIGDFEMNIKTQITQLNEKFSAAAVDTKMKIEKFETTQQEFVKTSTQMLDTKITETLDFLWGDVIAAMIDRAADRKYDGADLVNSFEKLLQTDIKISKDLKIQVIDTLMRCYYSTSKLDKKYDKMVSLIQTYDEYKLLPQTYVNAAIALTNNYELYGTPELRKTAISNCDKSIESEPSYGIPYAIKVEIFMIDLLKSRDDTFKQGITKQIDDLLYSVDSIDSSILKGEFLQRLILDKTVPFLKKYIDELYISFPVQLAPIRENVVYKLVKNLDKASDWEKKIMEDLLKEGLITNPDIDGKWKAVTFLEAGNNVAVEAGMFLELNSQHYAFLIKETVVESGYVFYLPNIEPNALSLVAVEGKNKDTITRGIYEIKEDGTLQLCLAQPTKEKPVTFLSDNANNYSLISLSKV